MSATPAASGTGGEYSHEETYISMSNPIFDAIVKRVSESYPYSCICFITEIVNEKLSKAFNKKKKEIEKKLTASASKQKVKIGQLFHGTNEIAAEAISRTGFLTKFNKTSAYGIGSYFARNAKYSFHFMHPGADEMSYMFLADVLIGKTCVGVSGKRAPKGVDTMVNKIKNPDIYVTPYDNGAYPRYLIAFHKSAK